MFKNCQKENIENAELLAERVVNIPSSSTLMNSKKIKIGYFVDGPWSHLAFEKLINDDSIEIKFIVPRNDTCDLTFEKIFQKNTV